jgi:hypothetical protein
MMVETQQLIYNGRLWPRYPHDFIPLSEALLANINANQ